MSIKQRYATAKPAPAAGLWGNAALALFKGIVGVVSGSKALLADAFHSAAQCAVYWGKQGRGQQALNQSRTESAVSVIVAVVLLILGLELGISAVRELIEGVDQPPHWSALAAVIIGIIVKELFLSSKERSLSLYSSLAAVIGVGGALVGQAVSLPALYYFDPAAAVIIAIIVMCSGYHILTATTRSEVPAISRNEEEKELNQLIQRVEGVVTVESLKAKEQGHYVVAEIVISVNPRISVLEGHEIAKRVKQLLLKRFGHVTEVTIHVEPYDPGYPYKSNHDPNQEHMPTLLQ